MFSKESFKKLIAEERLRLLKSRAYDDRHHIKYTYCLFGADPFCEDNKVLDIASDIVAFARENGAISEVLGWDWCYWEDSNPDYAVESIHFVKLVISDPIAKMIDDAIEMTPFEKEIQIGSFKGKLLDRSHLSYEKEGRDIADDPSECIIYSRCDHDGYKWWNTWWDGPAKDKTSNLKEVGEETTAVVFDLFKLLPNGVPDIRKLRDRGDVEVLSNDVDCNLYYRGLKADYWIRLIAREKDYNMYVKAYTKADKTK